MLWVHFLMSVYVVCIISSILDFFNVLECSFGLQNYKINTTYTIFFSYFFPYS